MDAPMRADDTGADRESRTLDPGDWEAFRALCHRMVDETVDWMREAPDRPVWRPVPDEIKAALREPPPFEGAGSEAACEAFARLIRPYGTGNTHPRFWGWVHGSGTPGGALAEFLAAAFNANLGGREHAPVYLERQVVDWSKAIFGMPATASGLLVSGTSMATLVGLAVARNHLAGCDVRRRGVAEAGMMVGYASHEAHGSVTKAFELLGLGRDRLRLVPVDAAGRMRIDQLQAAIAADRAHGALPFCVVGTAGTVNTGAVDDLAAIADICAEDGLWLHVDGAFGALAILVERLAPLLAGVERADSLAFDFHKWLHVPYDAGCILVRQEEAHRAAFSARQTYLAGVARGLAAGEPWFCEYGPELSRGFRALKVWFTLKEHGLRRLGARIQENCDQARYLAARVGAHPELRLAAPVALNIVCFRFDDGRRDAGALDALNTEIVADLQEHGVAAASTTRLDGRIVVRVCICNHRTTWADLDVFVDAFLAAARRRGASA
jgi:glutamate/tyrosine decarboxylase-like PLP-dependent enzyme